MSKKAVPQVKAPDDLSDSFRTFADAASVLIWITGPDKKCIFFNRAWLNFTGRSLAEELEAGYSSSIHPEDLERLYPQYEQAFDERRPFAFEYRLRRHDGEYRWILDNGAPVVGSNDTFLGYIGSCADIHAIKAADQERSKLQRQLFQSQKMESLGQFSARIAHDVNNALGVIRGHMQMLERVRTSPEKYQHCIDMALVGCDQGAQLIQDLLRFGSPATTAPVNTSARALVDKAVEFVGSVIDKKIRLRTLPGGERDQVLVDENQLLQVFTNLF